jgi:hypothetical protein
MAHDRRKKVPLTCYLRDRDFDYDPPQDCSAPVIDAQAGSTVLGWHWSRHEMESYLLEPRLVEQATGWAQAAYVPALLKAARQIVFYTSARWAVGMARCSLPPFRELSTRPENLSNEIKIPGDCSETGCDGWALTHVAAFFNQIEPVLKKEAVAAVLAERKQRLSSLSGPADVLCWHAGKDLLAALAPSLPGRFKDHPKVFLASLRNWVRDHPGPACALFPEWSALLAELARPG